MFARILRSIGMIIGGIALGVVVAFLFGWLVMLLWNWLMPVIFDLSTITFWQAWGLVILSHILFKTGNHHKPHNHPSPPWKNHFREKVKDRLFADEKNESAAESA
ncbi:hypothetical protein JW835_16835 [bacterium]|nr:hypothetical protein [bacterium]